MKKALLLLVALYTTPSHAIGVGGRSECYQNPEYNEARASYTVLS